METKQLRDKILREQAIYEQSLIQSEKSAAEVKEIFSKFTPEMVALCREYGVYVEPVLSIDLQRVQTDSVYRKECNELLGKTILSLHEVLERSLNV